MSDDGDRACILALTGLPGMGPHRLGVLLADSTPSGAWSLVRRGLRSSAIRPGHSLRGDVEALAAAWRAAARDLDPVALLDRYRAAGVAVLLPGDPEYPAALRNDPERPAVLFSRGDIGVLGGPSTVAVVGTRRCSSYGREVAFELGERLARAGVTVLSGLARGVDAAAHAGALQADAAPPAAVVGTGPDVPYPSSSAALWRRVAEVGVVVGEAPLGARPDRWRFPARNRILAALADLVVVVESPARGGAMTTVEEALQRGIGVAAVPGSVRSPLSVGPHRLLADGAAVVTSAADVLGLLGRATTSVAATGLGTRDPVDPVEGAVLDAVGFDPIGLDVLAERLLDLDLPGGGGLRLDEVAGVLESLAAGGRVRFDGGLVVRSA
jgi:DNA processing protein